MARISTYTTDTTLSPDDKWIGTDGAVGSENGKTKNFTVQGMADYVSDYIGEEGFVVKGVQVTLTQADILNPSGFSKLIVPPKAGKIIMPTSIALYRKPGGTSYNLSGGTVGLISIANSLAGAVIGASSLNIAFQTENESTTYPSINSGTTSSQRIRPGNSIYISLGTPITPGIATEGTGDLVLYLTYTEITIT
jgi:hypothetical protein